MGPKAPIYWIEAPRDQRANVRRLRGAVWRLHTEVEFLRTIGRLVRADPSRFNEARVADLIGSMSHGIAKEQRDGVIQPPLLALNSQIGPLDLTELTDLADLVARNSLGLARRLELAAERAERVDALRRVGWQGVRIDTLIAGEVVMGDKIEAHEGAVIINRSRVQDSFNRVEAKDTELSDALLAVLAAAQSSGDPQAVELAEGLIEFADQDKKALFATAWDRIREFAPVAQVAVGVAGVIARFLGVG